MKTLRAMVPAAELSSRTSLLDLLVEKAKNAIEKMKSRAKEKGPDVSEDIFVFDGATRRYIIPAIYWKVTLIARIFSSKSLFSLCDTLDGETVE